jgi:hypothetical protein
MSTWSAWDWIGYGCLAIAAFGVAISAVLKEHPDIVERLPNLFSGGIWSFVPAFMLVVGTIIFIVKHVAKGDRQSIEKERKSIARPISELQTFLKIRFGALNTLPSLVSQNNIFRWFSVKNVFGGIDSKTKQPFEMCLVNLFIAFDNPISFRQIQIDGSGLPLPRHEIKDSSPRTAVIAFQGDLVGIDLNVRAI